MTNPYGMPGYSVQEVADKLANNHNFILMDVREPHELLPAKIKTDYFDNVKLGS